MTAILFENARLIDPTLKMDMKGDLLTENGVIVAVAPVLPDADDAMRIDCRGAVLAPGLVDLHVHFRDPGLTRKETLETGCAAAAAGGFTAVVTMANTKPPIDSPEAVKNCIERNRSMDCRIYPAAAVTKAMAGKDLTDFAALKEAGAVCLSDDGLTVADGALFYEAFERAKALDLPVSVHCEAHGFEGDRSMNRGAISSKLGLWGTPATAEELMILRDLFFAEKTGAHVHVQHVSTARGVEMIADARRRGVNVTAEATPHHMVLDETAILEHGANAKMSPPLRLPEDAAAVREALMSGVLDVVATDHAPHTPEEKALGIAKAPNGVIGLETALAVCLDALCAGSAFPLPLLMERMSAAPRRIFDLPAVTLHPASAADLVLFDPEREWLVDASKFKSKGRNCPFNGRKLKGQVLLTLLGGRIVHDARRGGEIGASL